MAWLLWLLWLWLLGCALFFGLLYLQQDNVIFQTRPLDPLAEQRYRELAIEFDRNGTRLHGWFKRHPNPQAPLLVYYGGNAEEISWNLEAMQKLECSVLLINYRGYGQSQGQPSEQQLKSDALWLLDNISKQQNIPLERVILMGRSLGSGIATYVAHQRPVAGVILVTPYDSFIALAHNHYPWLPLGWLLKHRFESDRLAPEIDRPMLNLIADQDRVVPPRHAERLGQLWAGPVNVQRFATADHISITDQPNYWPSIRAFIAEHAPSPKSERH